ncbi:5-methylcytosine-specific restriction endonuclease McrA [Xanthomonas arboricola]
MPLVSNAVNFDAPLMQLIKEISNRPGHNHKDWDLAELEGLRRIVREHYRNEQRLTCAYCLDKVSHLAAHGAPVEHIAPKSAHLRFIFEPRNLCVICADCNQIKLNQETLNQLEDPLKRPARKSYPTSSEAFKIVHPHIDEYADHIIKIEYLYVGRTKKGDWTIMACGLNRFFHRFGYCQELLDDATTINEQANFHNSHVEPEPPKF